MQASFHTGNRQNMYASMLPGSIALIFAGHAPLKTGDEPWPFFAERNFVYLTGLSASSEGFILMAVKNAEGETKESLFILPPDLLKERWTGRRVKPDEATSISGIEDIRFLADFETEFHKASASCCHLYLDLGKLVPTEQDNEAYIMARKAAADYPHLQVHTLRPQLRKQRTIKQPCEIEALRVAEDVTRDGILAMMKAAKPGITEYQLKAEYDYALAQRGVLTPGFPSIISCGDSRHRRDERCGLGRHDLRCFPWLAGQWSLQREAAPALHLCLQYFQLYVQHHQARHAHGRCGSDRP